MSGSHHCCFQHILCNHCRLQTSQDPPLSPPRPVTPAADIRNPDTAPPQNEPGRSPQVSINVIPPTPPFSITVAGSPSHVPVNIQQPPAASPQAVPLPMLIPPVAAPPPNPVRQGPAPPIPRDILADGPPVLSSWSASLWSPASPFPQSPFWPQLHNPFSPAPVSSPGSWSWSSSRHTQIWPKIPPDHWHAASVMSRWFRSPGTFPAERLDAAIPIRVHPDLLYNPDSPDSPFLNWDLLFPPELSRVSGRGLLRYPVLDDLAFSPAEKKVHIYGDHPILNFWQTYWGPIKVEKGTGLKVRDVLHGIYDYFRQPLSDPELACLCATPGNMQVAFATLSQRAQEGLDLSMFVMNNVPTRMDVFGSDRKFKGLRATLFEDGSWVLYLGLMPGRVPKFW